MFALLRFWSSAREVEEVGDCGGFVRSNFVRFLEMEVHSRFVVLLGPGFVRRVGRTGRGTNMYLDHLLMLLLPHLVQKC